MVGEPKIAVIDQWGAYLGISKGMFQLRKGKKVIWEASPHELEAIVILVEGVSISVAAILMANRYNIDFVFMKMSREGLHTPIARLVQARHGSTLKNWYYQLKGYYRRETRTELAKLFVEGKTHNQRVVLMTQARRMRARGLDARWLEKIVRKMSEMIQELEKAESPKKAMSVESHVANLYWTAFRRLIPDGLGFKGRKTRSRLAPGEKYDPFNIALNIGYSILKRYMWQYIFLAGLNPYIGFLHKPRAGKMVLIWDLVEEFRPLVDRLLLGIARKSPEKLKPLAEDNKDKAREASRFVWAETIKYLRSGKPPYISVMRSQVERLLMHLKGTGRYVPFKLKW